MERIALDIGCGVGWHAIQFAQQNPEMKLYAIEHGQTRFEKLARRTARHPELSNIIPVQADAAAWVQQNIKSPCLEKVFFLYPNPYPKKNQAKKRFHNQDWMSSLVKLLAPTGEIIYVTNKESLAEESKSRFRDELGMHVKAYRQLGSVDLPLSRTHFEKKYLGRGETCYEYRFTRAVGS